MQPKVLSTEARENAMDVSAFDREPEIQGKLASMIEEQL